MQKRGQVTLFIMVGLAILVVVGLFVAFILNAPRVEDQNPANQREIKTGSQVFIEECVSRDLEEALRIVYRQGGYTYDKQPSLEYKFERVSYLCYTQYDELNCNNLEPALIGAVQNELIQNLTSSVETCFASLESSYSEYSPSSDPLEFSIEIVPKSINVNINKPLQLGEDEIQQSDFSFKINSPLYTFLSMAVRHSNKEVLCNCGEENCNSDYFNIDKFYRGFVSTRFTSPLGERVYTIEDLQSGNKFNFAVRNCIEEQ